MSYTNTVPAAQRFVTTTHQFTRGIKAGKAYEVVGIDLDDGLTGHIVDEDGDKLLIVLPAADCACAQIGGSRWQNATGCSTRA